jgi:hypothetical protein
MELADLIEAGHRDPSETFTNRGFTLMASVSAANRRLKEALTKCGYDPTGPQELVALPRRILDDVRNAYTEVEVGDQNAAPTGPNAQADPKNETA